MESTMRKIISESEQIVALDTTVGWELKKIQKPDWLMTFADMRLDGYHFCISDIFLPSS